MSKVYVGNLEARTSEREIEEKFRRYGKIRTVYIPRSSPNGGFAFVDFNDPRDADDAVRSMNGKHGWRVELAKPRRGERGDFRSSEGCYTCGEMGHFARDCPRSRGGGSYGGRDDYYRRDDRRGGYDDDRRRRVSRSRSRSPVRRGRSYSRSRSRSLSRSRSRDRSPRRDRSVSRDRSLSRSRSRDAPRDRSRSGSPPRDDYDNGHANGMDTDVPPRDGDKAE